MKDKFQILYQKNQKKKMKKNNIKKYLKINNNLYMIHLKNKI